MTPNSYHEQNSNRWPDIIKIFVKILEYRVSKIIGENTVDEIRTPLDKKVIQEKIIRAARRTEKSIQTAKMHEDIKKGINEIVFLNLPLFEKRLLAFADNPSASNELEKDIFDQFKNRFGDLIQENEIRLAANAYVRILKQNLVIMVPELGKLIVQLAELETADQTKTLVETQKEIAKINFLAESYYLEPSQIGIETTPFARHLTDFLVANFSGFFEDDQRIYFLNSVGLNELIVNDEIYLGGHTKLFILRLISYLTIHSPRYSSKVGSWRLEDGLIILLNGLKNVCSEQSTSLDSEVEHELESFLEKRLNQVLVPSHLLPDEELDSATETERKAYEKDDATIFIQINNKFISKFSMVFNSNFYKGRRATWNDIIANNDISRIHIQADIQTILETNNRTACFVPIIGGPGTGKSTTLRRLAYEYAQEEEYTVYFHDHHQEISINQFLIGSRYDEYSEQGRILLFIDDLPAFDPSYKILEGIEEHGLDIIVVFTAQAHLYSDKNIQSTVDPFILGNLDGQEAVELINLLERKNIVDILTWQKRNEIISQIENKLPICDAISLLLMDEEYDKSIYRSLDSLANSTPQLLEILYQVALLHNIGLSAPRKLIQKKLSGIAISETLAGDHSKSGLIVYDPVADSLQTRNQRFASVVVNRKYPFDSLLLEAYLSLIDCLDPNVITDRLFFVNFVDHYTSTKGQLHATEFLKSNTATLVITSIEKSGSPFELSSLADFQYRIENYQIAEKLLDQARRTDPINIDDYVFLIGDALKTGQPQNALSFARRGLVNFPNNKRISRDYFLTMVNFNRGIEFLQLAEEWLEENPNDWDVHWYVIKAVCEHPSWSIDQKIRRTQRFLNQEMPLSIIKRIINTFSKIGAISIIVEWVEILPEQTQIDVGGEIIFAYFRENRIEEAVNWAKKCQTNTFAVRAIVEIMCIIGRWTEAFNWRQQYPANSYIAFTLIKHLIRTKRVQEAIEIAEEDYFASQPHIWRLIIQYAVKVKQWAAVEEWGTRFEKNSFIVAIIAKGYIAERQLDNASRWVAKVRTNSFVVSMLIDAYANNGELDKARIWAEHHPNNTYVLRHVLKHLLRANEFEEAWERSQTCIDNNSYIAHLFIPELIKRNDQAAIERLVKSHSHNSYFMTELVQSLSDNGYLDEALKLSKASLNNPRIAKKTIQLLQQHGRFKDVESLIEQISNDLSVIEVFLVQLIIENQAYKVIRWLPKIANDRILILKIINRLIANNEWDVINLLPSGFEKDPQIVSRIIKGLGKSNPRKVIEALNWAERMSNHYLVISSLADQITEMDSKEIQDKVARLAKPFSNNQIVAKSIANMYLRIGNPEAVLFWSKPFEYSIYFSPIRFDAFVQLGRDDVVKLIAKNFNNYKPIYYKYLRYLVKTKQWDSLINQLDNSTIAINYVVDELCTIKFTYLPKIFASSNFIVVLNIYSARLCSEGRVEEVLKWNVNSDIVAHNLVKKLGDLQIWDACLSIAKKFKDTSRIILSLVKRLGRFRQWKLVVEWANPLIRSEYMMNAIVDQIILNIRRQDINEWPEELNAFDPSILNELHQLFVQRLVELSKEGELLNLVVYQKFLLKKELPLLVDFLVNQGRFDEALSWETLAPPNIQERVHIILGIGYARQENWAKSMQYLSPYLAIPYVSQQLIPIYARSGKWDDAFLAAESFRSNPSVMLELITRLANAKRWEDVVEWGRGVSENRQVAEYAVGKLAKAKEWEKALFWAQSSGSDLRVLQALSRHVTTVDELILLLDWAIASEPLNTINASLAVSQMGAAVRHTKITPEWIVINAHKYIKYPSLIRQFVYSLSVNQLDEIYETIITRANKDLALAYVLLAVCFRTHFFDRIIELLENWRGEHKLSVFFMNLSKSEQDLEKKLPKDLLLRFNNVIKIDEFSLQEIIELSNWLIRFEFYSQAEDLLENILRGTSQSQEDLAEIWNSIGNLRRRRRDYMSAIDAFNNASVFNPINRNKYICNILQCATDWNSNEKSEDSLLSLNKSILDAKNFISKEKPLWDFPWLYIRVAEAFLSIKMPEEGLQILQILPVRKFPPGSSRSRAKLDSDSLIKKCKSQIRKKKKNNYN